MKKLLLLLALLIPWSAQAQYSILETYRTATAGTDTVINTIGSSTAWHKLQWNITGTLSACSVKVQQSADGSTSWTDLIGAQTCTSNGTSALVNTVANYIRINITVLTPNPSGTVTATYTGYINAPSSVGASGSGTNTYLAKFTGASTLANSSITDDGTTVTVNEDFVVTGTSTAQINQLVLGAVQTSGDTNTFDWPALGATPSSGLSFRNTTAAADGAQQASPSALWSGQGWDPGGTGNTQVQFQTFVLPVQGTPATGLWKIQSKIAAGSWTDRFTLDNSGTGTLTTLTASNLLVTGGGRFVPPPTYTITGASPITPNCLLSNTFRYAYSGSFVMNAPSGCSDNQRLTFYLQHPADTSHYTIDVTALHQSNNLSSVILDDVSSGWVKFSCAYSTIDNKCWIDAYLGGF